MFGGASLGATYLGGLLASGGAATPPDFNPGFYYGLNGFYSI